MTIKASGNDKIKINLSPTICNEEGSSEREFKYTLSVLLYGNNGFDQSTKTKKQQMFQIDI